MGYSATRLDRLVSKKLSISKREVQTLIAQRRVLVNDVPASFASLPIKQFTRVTVDKTDIQN
ncbi:S4 domain-containing protein, partial [Oleiphilus sp. HI0123]